AAVLVGQSTLSAVSAGTVTITGMVSSTTGFNAGMANAIVNVIAAPLMPSLTVLGASYNFTRLIKADDSPISEAAQYITVIGQNLNGAVSFSSSLSVVGFSFEGGANANPLLSAVINGNLIPTQVLVSFNTTVAGTYDGTITISTTGVAATVFTVSGIIDYITSVSEFENSSFKLYPNPVTNGILYFDSIISGQVYNATGIEVLTFVKASTINVANLSKGIYLLKTNDNQFRKFIIE
ncbi:MAG: T9SS type A sorting domain-containing protein, partial [Cytophagales bacterium]